MEPAFQAGICEFEPRPPYLLSWSKGYDTGLSHRWFGFNSRWGRLPTSLVNIFKQKKFDVYIGRGVTPEQGYFGNPIKLEDCSGDRALCVQKYKDYFLDRIKNDSEFRSRVLSLKDKTLGCFCYPKLCHGMVIIEFLDGTPISEQIQRTQFKEDPFGWSLKI